MEPILERLQEDKYCYTLPAQCCKTYAANNSKDALAYNVHSKQCIKCNILIYHFNNTTILNSPLKISGANNWF